MTSKKLSAKKLFERLLKQEYIRAAWAEGIIIIALIFVLPVSVALDLGRYSHEIASMPEGILMEFMSQSRILLLLIFLIGAFAAVLEFGYLFQRSKVDFFHSLPISRGMQFLYRYLTGFLLFAIPYIVLYGAAILVGIAHGAIIIGYVRELAGLAVIYLAFYWVFYSVSVIAVLLAGSYLSSILTLLFLHFAGPCFCLLIRKCEALFFRTYMETGNPLLYGSGSAFTISEMILEKLNLTGYYDSFSLVVLLAMVILLPLAGCVLFLWRPAEKTGCGLAFPLIGPVIRFLAVTGIGVLIGIMLRMMSYNNSDFWLFFGIIAGCIIMHCIMQMVLQMNFRAFLLNKVSMLVCTAAAVIFMCVFRFDLTGYDTYLPAAEQLDSVGISLDDMEYYRNYTKEYTAEEYSRLTNVVYSYTNYSSQEVCSILSQMNLTNVQPVLNLASVSVQNESWTEYGNMKVCYRLKNGRCVYRDYYIELKDNMSEISEIFAMDRYKEALYPILTRGEENCTVWLNDGYSENKKKLSLEDTQYITLLRTYKRELKDLTVEVMEEEEPQLLLEFTDNQMDCYNSYPVYPSFEHTLTLLKGYGYSKTNGPEFIYKARIDYEETESEMDGASYLIGSEGAGFEEWDGTSGASGSYNVLWTEDPEQIEALKPYLISVYYSSMNMTLQDVEPGYYVSGYMTDEVTGEEMVSDFFIKKGKVPDFLKALKKNSVQNVG